MSNLQSLSRIINAPISANAKILWMIIAMSVEDGKQETWVRQASLAEQLGCSRSTVGRMLRVLKEAQLIVDTGKRHAGRYKVYELTHAVTTKMEGYEVADRTEKPSHSEAQRARVGLGDTSDVEMTTKKEPSPDLTKVKSPSPAGRGVKLDIADELLAQFGDSWRRRFPLIDGKDGRHSLEAGVREASQYKFWHKHSPTMSGWIEEWLTTAVIHYSKKPKPKQQDLPVN